MSSNKKIVTMVGTSLFENYRSKRDDVNFQNCYTALEKMSATELDKEVSRKNTIKGKISQWIEGLNEKRRASAEFSSIVQIMRNEKLQNAEIYLIASDTALSRLAAEIISEKLKDVLSEHSLSAEPKHSDFVKKLQVKSEKDFVEGMKNLINKLENEIAKYYWGNVIINITGGYKATVPYLTVLALVNRCPIYYIFEELDELIKIPYLPISINEEIFKKHEKLFMDLEREKVKEIPKGLTEEERFDIEALLEEVDNLYSLNPLGVILWNKYKSNFWWFYLSPYFKDYLNSSSPAYKEAVKESMRELARRLNENPSEDSDLNHSLKGVELPKGFKVFKHKASNQLQVRLLYKKKDWNNKNGYDIYIALGACGNEVHNAGSNSEYVESFERNRDKIENLKDSDYELEKLKRDLKEKR